MGFFRRSRPLHDRLADAGGFALAGSPPAGTDGRFGRPPGWDGSPSPFGEAGVHGVPRARRWDAVASAEAPRLRGNEVRFVALPDGRLVVDEDERRAAVAPLAAAVQETLTPPYRAEAVRRDATVWAVAACRIETIDAPELEGEMIELTVVGGQRTLVVDGGPSLQPARALELAGEARGSDYVVRAHKLDGSLWQVEPAAL